MPRVSIITPTYDRAEFLPGIWKCVREQSVDSFEWLVLDGSRQPSPIFRSITDARVRYLHNPNRMTIGAMRNALCESATGDIVALFDDDDFYAPHYIEGMLSLMEMSASLGSLSLLKIDLNQSKHLEKRCWI